MVEPDRRAQCVPCATRVPFRSQASPDYGNAAAEIAGARRADFPEVTTTCAAIGGTADSISSEFRAPRSLRPVLVGAPSRKTATPTSRSHSRDAARSHPVAVGGSPPAPRSSATLAASPNRLLPGARACAASPDAYPSPQRGPSPPGRRTLSIYSSRWSSGVVPSRAPLSKDESSNRSLRRPRRPRVEGCIRLANVGCSATLSGRWSGGGSRGPSVDPVVSSGVCGRTRHCGHACRWRGEWCRLARSCGAPDVHGQCRRCEQVRERVVSRLLPERRTCPCWRHRGLPRSR